MGEVKQQVSTSQVPKISGKSHGSKMMLFIFGAVMVMLIGLGGYVLQAKNTRSSVANNALPQPSPTPDPIVSWKTYRNTKVGFEMKYPLSYKTPYVPIQGGLGGSKEVDGSEDATTISFDKPSTSKLGSEGILLVVSPYSSTLDMLVKNPPSSPYFDYDHPTQKLRELTIDGKQAYWFKTSTDKGEESDFEIFFVGKSHAFILQTGLTHDLHEIDQILSTFQFSN